MEIFDTHLHLQDFETLLPEWGRSGFRCVCVSAKISDWDKVTTLYKAYPVQIAPAFGLHPWYADQAPENFALILARHLESFPKALVGECGLDRVKGAPFETQQNVFDAHIRLAKAYQRPLLIHCVKAWGAMEAFWRVLPEKFVIHSFNARPEQARLVLRSGGYIAVNSSILANKTAEEVLNLVPADKLLLESDAPYQTKLSNLPELCAKIAEIRGEKLEYLEHRLYLNAKELVDD